MTIFELSEKNVKTRKLGHVINKAAFIMYHLGGGGGGGEKFYKSVLHFLLSHRTVSQKFRLPPRGWIRFCYPSLLEYEFFILTRYAMTAVHCFCHIGGGGGISAPSWSSVQPSGTLKILNLKIPKRGQKTIAAIQQWRNW